MSDRPTSDKAFVPQPPFDSSSPGDCILQSTEGVQFKVFRQILILASPVMADMFSLPHGESATASDEGGFPIIPMDEDAGTIQNILNLLYPTSVLKELSALAAIKLVRAYDKYLIPKDRLRGPLEAVYGSRKKLESYPVELYKIALEFEMTEEAKIASRFTHKISFKDLYLALPLELLEQFMDLRRRREEGLDELVAVLKPLTYLCQVHKADDSEFSRQHSAIKDQ
ncbi:hypothetical protein FRB90_008563, partial [Tulasnella sp. 427]